MTPPALADRPGTSAMPWIVVAGCAAAYAVSDAVRLGERPPAAVLLTSAGLIVVALAALAVDRRTSHPRVHLALLVGAMVLTAAALFAPAVSEGVTAVTMPGVVLIAAYAGLIVPRSGWLIAALAAGITAVQVGTPEASALEFTTLLTLVVAAWAFGRICGAVHERARRLAMQLSRTDRLVHTLNRRGFTEELAYRLAVSDEQVPVILIVLDLADFKAVNQAGGSAAGDALLERVGDRLGGILPDGAIARLGGDEFAIAALGLDELDARTLARSVQREIDQLHPTRVGFTTAQHSIVNLSDLLRTADAAARRSRESGEPVEHLVAGITSTPAATAAPAEPILTYTRLRALGGRPTKPSRRLIDGRAQRDGFLALAAAGAVIVIGSIVQGPDSVAEQLVAYGGVAWVLLCLGLSARGALLRDRVATGADVMLLACLLAGGGVAIGAAASGGVLSPLIGGLYLLILVAAALVRGGSQWLCGLLVLTAYLGVLAASPADERWAATFQLALLAGAFGLGRINRSALDNVTAEWLAIARRDQLTGLLNRFGFDEELQRVVDAAPAGARYALFTFDLDRFRDINAGGYQAGDQVLRDVAAALLDAVPAGYTARRGADEFVAAIRVADPREADALLATLSAQIRRVHPTSAGVAILPDDATALDDVLRISALRTRTAKLEAGAAT